MQKSCDHPAFIPANILPRRLPVFPLPLKLPSLIPSFKMAPSAVETDSSLPSFDDPTILSLRKALTLEPVPLARRFRALFSLKHHACLHPPTPQTLPAIHAIASAFPSPSALLKHELAYCLGQTRNLAAVPFLRHVLEDRSEDSMCRHEAAEALGALGDEGSLELLTAMRDDAQEVRVVRETCEIAVGRIHWEHSGMRKMERLRDRYGLGFTSRESIQLIWVQGC